MEIMLYNTLLARVQEDQRSKLEAGLPEGFKPSGYKKGSEKFLTQYVYHFTPELTREQISDITNLLQDIGAASWEFRASKKTNAETGNKVLAALVEKA